MIFEKLRRAKGQRSYFQKTDPFLFSPNQFRFRTYVTRDGSRGDGFFSD